MLPPGRIPTTSIVVTLVNPCELYLALTVKLSYIWGNHVYLYVLLSLKKKASTKTIHVLFRISILYLYY